MYDSDKVMTSMKENLTDTSDSSEHNTERLAINDEHYKPTYKRAHTMHKTDRNNFLSHPTAITIPPIDKSSIKRVSSSRQPCFTFPHFGYRCESCGKNVVTHNVGHSGAFHTRSFTHIFFYHFDFEFPAVETDSFSSDRASEKTGP